MDTLDKAFDRKCLACEASWLKVTLYTVFDGDFFYCAECMERYSIPLPTEVKL